VKWIAVAVTANYLTATNDM